MKDNNSNNKKIRIRDFSWPLIIAIVGGIMNFAFYTLGFLLGMI